MKRSLCCLFFTCLLGLTPVYAATQTLTTYYPAPNGNYKNMVVNNTFTLGPGGSCVTQSGQNIALVDVGGYLEFCDVTGGPYILTQGTSNLWATSGTMIYPYKVAQKVIIGSASNPPSNPNGYALGVTGLADFMGGNLGIGNATPQSLLDVYGPAWFRQTTAQNTWYPEINLGEYYGSASTAPGLELFQVAIDDDGGWGHMKFWGARWGNTIQFDTNSSYNNDIPMLVIGGGGASPTSLNLFDNTGNPGVQTISLNAGGSTYFNGGNVGIGAAAPTEKVQINGQQTNPGGTLPNPTTVPGIKICSASGTNCGYLAVTQGASCSSGGDCNYYAVYGP